MTGVPGGTFCSPGKGPAGLEPGAGRVAWRRHGAAKDPRMEEAAKVCSSGSGAMVAEASNIAPLEGRLVTARVSSSTQ